MDFIDEISGSNCSFGKAARWKGEINSMNEIPEKSGVRHLA